MGGGRLFLIARYKPKGCLNQNVLWGTIERLREENKTLKTEVADLEKISSYSIGESLSVVRVNEFFRFCSIPCLIWYSVNGASVFSLYGVLSELMLSEERLANKEATDAQKEHVQYFWNMFNDFVFLE